MERLDSLIEKFEETKTVISFKNRMHILKEAITLAESSEEKQKFRAEYLKLANKMI